MIPCILLILFVLNYCTYTAVIRKEEPENGTPARSRNRFWIYLVLAADVIIVGLIAFFLCASEASLLERGGIILIGIALILFAVGWMLQRWNRKRWILWGLCVALGVFCLSSSELNQKHQDQITMRESFDYGCYIPFVSDSHVVKMDETAALRFTIGDTLPRLDGTGGLYPVYAAFAQATYPDYLWQKQPRVILDFVDYDSTARAYERLVDGECDMIFIAVPSDEQEADARQKGVELVYTPIGREALVFIVHPKNPIEDLTLDQIRGIYSGNITGWSQLDMSGLGNILAYQRNEYNDSQAAMERFVMKGTPLMTPPKEKFEDETGKMVDRVSDYQNRRNAIGYALRFCCTAITRNTNVKLLTIDGVAPTAENMESGAYPLTFSIYAVTRSDANESTRALLDWICGEQGQALVEKAGYVRASGKN